MTAQPPDEYTGDEMVSISFVLVPHTMHKTIIPLKHKTLISQHLLIKWETNNIMQIQSCVDSFSDNDRFVLNTNNRTITLKHNKTHSIDNHNNQEFIDSVSVFPYILFIAIFSPYFLLVGLLLQFVALFQSRELVKYSESL